MEFYNADKAFRHYYNRISMKGVDFAGTKCLFNVGFTLLHPLANNIETGWRGFSLDYAKAEWEWYLSGDPSINKLEEIYGKVPPIWETMADWKKEVRSNYGWQWEREHQLDKVVQMLQENPDTRQAVISIYDGKEIGGYRNDTPCTYAVQFSIFENRLNMAVLMRSNDLWFGFCNDQYCFSKLQEMVASRVGISIGTYYHHASNLHIYNRHLDKQI